MPKLRVGVIFGGRSGEHEVSLISARSIMAVMDREKYEIIPIGITHRGKWLVEGDPLAELLTSHDRPLGPDEANRRRPTVDRQRNFMGCDDAADLSVSPAAASAEPMNRQVRAELLCLPPLDVVFPVLHGPFGEDGTIQGLLELADLPYVGCGVLSSAIAMDKAVCKKLLAAHGLPVVPGLTVLRREWEARPEWVIAAAEAALSYPMFIKPANLGSSIGVHKARHREQLAGALVEAARYDRKLLIERAVPNTREIECSVLGNDDPIASVPGEIIPVNEYYDYDAKYVNTGSRLLIPAPLEAETTAALQAAAIQAFRAIDGAGMARVDFLMDGETGEWFIGEINTIPGFTAISMYPKLWAASGIPYGALIDRLIELALERHAEQSRSERTYAGAISPTQSQL